jgi:hypothetical protein
VIRFQILSLPNVYKYACVAFFGFECVIMLLANALVFVDACPAPTNLQKYLGAREVFTFCFHACCCRTLAVFVLSLDASFLFVIFAIFALGLDSTELLQRHFGTTDFVVSFLSILPPYLSPASHECPNAGIAGFTAIHQLGASMQSITSPR